MSIKYEVHGVVNEDGSWAFRAAVADGQQAIKADVLRLLALAAEFYSRAPLERLLTVAEMEAQAAEPLLPDGWEATADGHNTLSRDGVLSYSRNYARATGDERAPLIVEAPCAGDGSPIPATRAALLAAGAQTAEA